jgi:sigma-54 dependent transcriptional regulator, acetoin dehydrogenase operon transcriptional activator AcoR
MSDEPLLARARLHEAPLSTLPPRLLASWERSEAYGVPLETVDPVFSGTQDDESLFFQCGQEVLSGLAQTLANEPVSMMLTDPEGRVLNRFSGDQSLLRALDAVHLAPGFSYAEREAGTNGLGLALADRVPTVVRAEQHYALSLCTYTCAAVPVLDQLTGRLEGAVNLTTWSTSSSDLLLALAQSAAGTTSALMLARAQGRHAPRPVPRGEVFRVEAPRLEPGLGTLGDLSVPWTDAHELACGALGAGRIVTALGEPGSGRSTLLAQAQRLLNPRARILAARSPAPQDVEAWLSLWSPELAKPDTAIVVCDVDALPLWAAERLRDLVVRARNTAQPGGLPFAMTAERFEDIPAPLTRLVETVVHVPSLRERSDDVVPLARHLASRSRGREVQLTPAAERALQAHAWPGNVTELATAIRAAATRADVIDVRHLPPAVLVGTSRRLSRIEAVERDEIVRVLSQPDTSMTAAARELGMSRATIYRKVAHYDIHVPR